MTNHQLFSLIVLFELGSSIVIGLAVRAKQDAWLAVLAGLLGGLVLLTLYVLILRLCPGMSLTQCFVKAFGRYIGRPLAFAYCVYFLYLSARVLRDFGALLLTSALPDTPMSAVNLIMILVILYGAVLGIGALARAGEIFLYICVLIALLGVIVLLFSNVIKLENFLPILENGWGPVWSAAFPQAVTFPFGEVIVFTMFSPYLIHTRGAIRTAYRGMIVSGLILAFVTALNIGALGTFGLTNAVFPLLKTTALIKVGNFLQRLEAFTILLLIVGGYFKIVLFFLGGVLGLGEILFDGKPGKFSKGMCGLLALAVWSVSLLMARSFPEHAKVGLDIVPRYVHIPMQMIIPVLLLLMLYVRKLIQGKGQGRSAP
ncbi:GerAB/ArcD/ProY family transporter [Paenibacillus aurantius]|uniref:GerAB/ArcD/ProY family transporter n=1 Tax=Paenibacillus aurantius TaxID=2918900 RepID=A0AA96RCD3_9BACL|nr:GerAB/ArcD/ProY family transporter [Paenibacillus aurantius]WNQ10405.1 GerAB/ArcD/ProY family transporter [Paenibacillus aurantius]